MGKPPASFDFDHLVRLLEQASRTRRLSITTRDKRAAQALERLADEIDYQISQLAHHIVHESFGANPEQSQSVHPGCIDLDHSPPNR